MTSPPPTLMTLPVELRSNIFYLALLNTPELLDPDPPYRRSIDLSLLSTNRQVYYETRAIPLAIHYFGSQYDPNVNFLSSLHLRSFQIAALKSLIIEYLSPSDLTNFFALGSENGYLFGETALDLDLLVIYADDWIGDGARRWRYAASPEDAHYNLPKSSRWLRAFCGLKGWKQLEIALPTRELVDEYWRRNRFMQTLFDEFRSPSGNLNEAFTIWHQGQHVPYERIAVLRTKELGRYKQPEWWRADVGKLIEGRECVLGANTDINEDERGRPAFHVQERCSGPGKRTNHCTRCQPDCGCYLAQQ